MPRYSSVLFDLDGTLIDSVRLILDSYHHTMTVHGLPARTDAEWLEGLGTPLRAQFSAWAETETRMAELIATYREYNMAHHDSRVTAYPGVAEVVRSLQASGTRLGIVTSKNRAGALRGLRLVGLEDAMEIVIGADSVSRHKPDPEPVLAALAATGIDARDTLFVGDSPHDMLAGRAAGTATGAVLWGPFSRSVLEATTPDHWFADPAHLLHLMESPDPLPR